MSTDLCGTCISHASRIAQSYVGEVEKSIRNVHKLGLSVKAIQDIIQNINDIAEKTKVLAINASIEAARAGTAGKGFVVVAGEVKKLAELSAQNSEEISRHLHEIRSEADLTVKNMESISGVVKEISDINIHIADEVDKEFQSVKKVSEVNEEAVNQSVIMLESLKEVSNGTRNVSERIGNSYRELEQIMETSRVSIERKSAMSH